jgi:hypothetical protein
VGVVVVKGVVGIVVVVSGFVEVVVVVVGVGVVVVVVDVVKQGAQNICASTDNAGRVAAGTQVPFPPSNPSNRCNPKMMYETGSGTQFVSQLPEHTNAPNEVPLHVYLSHNPPI